MKLPKGGPRFGIDGGGPGGPQLPPGTYAIRLNDRDQVVRKQLFSYGESGLAKPELPSDLPISNAAAAPTLFTVPASDGSSPDFRALAIRPPGSRATIIVAVPLRELTQTLDRLRTIELIVSGAVLLALGILAWLVIKAGLRPLERMGRTADAIAAGDLSQRVEPANERTEVGRLGLALNGMLGQIEVAFAEREASEERLRRFLADASHELRTPLSSIRGYAEIFRTGAAREPQQLAQAMQRIEDEALRMGVLVNDLLALARLDEVRESLREPVDLAAVAQAACDDARALAPDRTITLEHGRAPRSSAIPSNCARYSAICSATRSNTLQRGSRSRSRSAGRRSMGHPERARSRTGPRARGRKTGLRALLAGEGRPGRRCG